MARVWLSIGSNRERERHVRAAVAALTVYDMVKAVERGAEVVRLRLDYKSGGKSGVYRRRE